MGRAHGPHVIGRVCKRRGRGGEGVRDQSTAKCVQTDEVERFANRTDATDQSVYWTDMQANSQTREKRKEEAVHNTHKNDL
jgi:hypothetical protein